MKTAELFGNCQGNNEMLEKLNKNDLMIVNRTRYGFNAVTNKYKNIKKRFPEIVMERASLEDIFLAKTEVLENETNI